MMMFYEIILDFNCFAPSQISSHPLNLHVNGNLLHCAGLTELMRHDKSSERKIQLPSSFSMSDKPGLSEVNLVNFSLNSRTSIPRYDAIASFSFSEIRTYPETLQQEPQRRQTIFCNSVIVTALQP